MILRQEPSGGLLFIIRGMFRIQNFFFCFFWNASCETLPKARWIQLYAQQFGRCPLFPKIPKVRQIFLEVFCSQIEVLAFLTIIYSFTSTSPVNYQFPITFRTQEIAPEKSAISSLSSPLWASVIYIFRLLDGPLVDPTASNCWDKIEAFWLLRKLWFALPDLH